MTNSIAAGSLAGIKVIDLSRVLGGPYCTQILADHGAEVIKIEPPQGDETREWGPPFKDEMSAYFTGANRGKRCLALDLAQPEGREVLLRLLTHADVLVENFKPGSLKKWQLDYHQDLEPRFPRLVQCSITGFGDKGSLGGFPGYDAVAQAWTGILSVNGSAESGPQRMGLPLVDITTGMNAALGIMLALFERNRSGRGQLMTTSLFETGLSLQHPHAANFLMSGQVAKPQGSAHTNISPYDLFQTASVPVFLAVGNDAQFAKLCQELKRPELASDPRFLHNENRLTHRLALKIELEKSLGQFEGRAFAEHLMKQGVPAGPVLTIKEALEHEQTKACEMILSDGSYRGISSPIKLSRTPSRQVGRPQKFSESSLEILREFKYTEEEIERLRKNQTVPLKPRK